MTTFRVALFSPDRHVRYDGRTPDATGAGGGVTARISLLSAFARVGHDVTAYVNCAEPSVIDGVLYLPFDRADRVEADVVIAITTGGELSLASLASMHVNARLKIVWLQGVPKPAHLDAFGADYFYAASNFLRDVCVERWHVDPARVFVCYNGVKQELFEAVEAAPPPRDPFSLAYIGPAEKGRSAALEILRRLRACDERYHLDTFGGRALWGGPADPPSDQLGVTDRGKLGQSVLMPELFKHEYCLAPQAMEEGFGIAVQEAKRAGMIVFASGVGAFRELITTNYDGFVIPEPHDADTSHDHVVRLIRSLQTEPARREWIRTNAMQTPWSWKLAARTWTAHWQHVLSANSARGSSDGWLSLPDGWHDPVTGRYLPTAQRPPLPAPHARLTTEASTPAPRGESDDLSVLKGL